jgi:hypothetical protein
VQMAQQARLAEAAIPQQSLEDLIRGLQPTPMGRTYGGLVPDPFGA